MPTYDYKCINGHEFEELQGINDPSILNCPQCGKEAKRIIGSGSGLMFKGSGFYITDYKKSDSKDSKKKDS